MCWGHCPFSSWLALGDLGGRGLALVSRAAGPGRSLAEAGVGTGTS